MSRISNYLENVKDLKVEVNVSDLGLVGLLQGVIVLHSVSNIVSSCDTAA